MRMERPLTKDRKDSAIHLPESLPGVTAGGPEYKVFPDTKGWRQGGKLCLWQGLVKSPGNVGREGGREGGSKLYATELGRRLKTIK